MKISNSGQWPKAIPKRTAKRQHFRSARPGGGTEWGHHVQTLGQVPWLRGTMNPPKIRFAIDSSLEGDGFKLVWGFSCQVVVFGLLAVLCSERESRSSFFNRAAGGKRVFVRFRLEENSSQHGGGTSLAKCCFFVWLRAVSSSRPVNRHAKGTFLPRWVRLCPGSEQECPARVAQCPHEPRATERRARRSR